MHVCVCVCAYVCICVYAWVCTYTNVLFFVLSVKYLEHQVIIMIATLAQVIFDLLISGTVVMISYFLLSQDHYILNQSKLCKHRQNSIKKFSGLFTEEKCCVCTHMYVYTYTERTDRHREAETKTQRQKSRKT